MFFTAHKKVDRTQEHRLLYWTPPCQENTETSHTSLNMSDWTDSRKLWLFTEQKTVGRTPYICAFFSRRWWTGSRNFILFIEHKKVGWVQKLNILYWTRAGWQSPKTSCTIFNTNRWSEWWNFESFIEHEKVIRVQKLGVLYWTESYGPCTGNVTSYDSS